MARFKKTKKRISLKELTSRYFSNFKFGVLATLIINIVTVSGSIFALYLTELDDIIKTVFIVLLFLYAIIAICIFIHLACIELKYYSDKYNDMVNNNELSKALPETFTFRNRKDVFVVEKTGDAVLTWDFEIEKITNNNLSFISIPIVCEYVNEDQSESHNEENTLMEEDNTVVQNEVHDKIDNENKNLMRHPIQIEDFRVNGISQTNYQYIHFSTDYNRVDRPIERGLIRIPLFTASTKGGIENVTLRIRFKDMFHNFEKREFVIVDIPYITKRICVVIKHQDNTNYDINVIDNYFDVREMYSNTFDAGEVARQLNNCSIVHNESDNSLSDNDYLLWESDFPKLGYRYTITFNFMNRKQKNNVWEK